jgi:hypothetical protein
MMEQMPKAEALYNDIAFLTFTPYFVQFVLIFRHCSSLALNKEKHKKATA